MLTHDHAQLRHETDLYVADGYRCLNDGEYVTQMNGDVTNKTDYIWSPPPPKFVASPY